MLRSRMTLEILILLVEFMQARESESQGGRACDVRGVYSLSLWSVSDRVFNEGDSITPLRFVPE